MIFETIFVVLSLVYQLNIFMLGNMVQSHFQRIELLIQIVNRQFLIIRNHLFVIVSLWLTILFLNFLNVLGIGYNFLLIEKSLSLQLFYFFFYCLSIGLRIEIINIFTVKSDKSLVRKNLLHREILNYNYQKDSKN